MNGPASRTHPGNSKSVSVPGLFSQTILPSPLIKWILPARIRNKDHNDVVLVSERRVQIKEAVADGYLKDVAEKTDFGGPIVAAKVLNVAKQLPLFSFYCLPSPDNKNGDEFVTFRRPLPVDVSLDQRFGKSIAVDPKSRAIAVSAWNDFFGIFRLKSADQIQEHMSERDLDHIQHERFMKIEGDILFMEFLYPGSDRDKSITLLIIADQDGETCAITYTWQEDKDIMKVPPIENKFKLRDRDMLPTMIVPLTKKSSFLVVTTTSMAVYSWDGKDRPKRYPLLAPNSDISAASIWTQWARPARNELYNRSHDGIYLCREDGWIYLLEFGNEGDLEAQTSLGQLHCDVDTAFDVLDMGHEGGDFILAAGSTGDGGLFVQEARAGPKCVQRFLNWAPTKDAAMVVPGSHSTSQGSIAQNRLFTCSETHPKQGALYEYRWGVEAPLGITVPLEDLSSIHDMWIIPHHGGGEFILLSDPLSTLVLYTNMAVEEGITALDEDDTGFDSGRTLLAGETQSGVVVQVTEKGIHAFDSRNIEWKTVQGHKPDTYIIAVALHSYNSILVILSRTADEISIHPIKIESTQGNPTLKIGSHLHIGERQPVCLCSFNSADSAFVFMGCANGSIVVYSIIGDQIVQISEASVSLSGEHESDLSTVVESMAAIENAPESVPNVFLLCGLRSGLVVSFGISYGNGGLGTLTGSNDKDESYIDVFHTEMRQIEATRLGTTSVRLQSQHTFALLTCGDELWIVSFDHGLPNTKYHIRRVWVTDQNNPAYFPVALRSFYLAWPYADAARKGDVHGPLYCFADRQLLICSLHHEMKMVPRRIDLPGKAQKLTYSPMLRSLVVAYETLEVEDPESPFVTTTRSHIEFVDPDSQMPVVHGGMNSPWRPTSSRGEIISCMLDWIFEKEGKTYHMLAVGTTLPSVSTAEPGQGRLILLLPRRDATKPSHIECTTQFVRDLGSPVRALASYGDSILIGSGNRLIPMGAKGSLTKWRRNAVGNLPSTAIKIVVHDVHIYVMTARHSWIVFEVIESTSDSNEGATLALASWDPVTRDGLTHILHGSKPVMLSSHRGGRVSASPISDSYSAGENITTLTSSHPTANLAESVLQFVAGSKNDENLYGFTVQGSVNLCIGDKEICPSIKRGKRLKNPLVLHVHGAHIDGDVLSRLVSRGPSYLSSLIGQLDANSGGDRARKTFDELAARALGEEHSGEAVICWLASLLEVDLGPT
ncbi:hypothetical protein N7470_008252 [Penicillium chermesinum]|nr:hypothetical protein N7470_008252 [Penicillium chermesinum]